ncbi:MAG: right-handed parallel beta-helix repeat-containing protein [Candidatus Thermoplasmatota archaeon]|nr:right-handed parallel beta-helix repeat-containing protein [Candidatus Thermoplasmatota archaeon]
MGTKGDLFCPGVVLALALCLFMGLQDTASGEKNTPVLTSPGAYETPGDWIVESGDDLLWENAKITLNGNLSVRPGGKLVLSNVQLMFNCTKDGLLGLTVEEGGIFLVAESIITSRDQSKHFRMVLRGSVTFEKVQVSEIYGDPDNPWDYGIELGSSSISIQNCTFLRCMGDVLNVESSSPRIIGNHFYENMGAAIYTNGSSSPFISKNTISRQRFGLISGYYSSPLIDGNTIFDIDDNGIILNGYMYPKVSNNTISNCLNGMLLWFSNADLENNVIYNNDAGYNIKVGSRPTIKGDIVRNNVYFGISINDSVVEMVDCKVYSNRMDGIRVFNGSRARVNSCSVERNDDDGLQVTDAYVELRDTVVSMNKGDQFLLMDSSVVDLIDSTVSGMWGGPAGSEVWQLNIGSGCTVSAYDAVFDREGVAFGDERSKLSVSCTCSFQVRNERSEPVPDATIRTYNETGYKRTLGTGLDGRGERYLPLYEQGDMNGDGDGADPGEMRLHSYNYTVEAKGYLPETGDVHIEGGDQINVTLIEIPHVRILRTLPENGDLGVDVSAVIQIWFDRDIDPSTFNMELTGPGGSLVFFDTSYRSTELMLQLYTLEDLAYGTTYTVEIKGVTGTGGEKLQSTVYLSFRTAPRPEPDNDEDGIPDKDDRDDDNDGFDDTVEGYHGTDPLDPLDHPVVEEGDDDVPGTDPIDPVDDERKDDDDEIVIIPGRVDDDESPSYDDYDPVNTTDTVPDGPDEGTGNIILVIGTILGLFILVGVVVLVFIRDGGGHRLREVETRPPGGG